MIYEHLGSMFGLTDLRGKLIMDDISSRPTLENQLVFTFVRNPAITALRAYLEVMRREGGQRWNTDNCVTEFGATSQFVDYLAALESGEFRSEYIYHSWPQAMKVIRCGKQLVGNLTHCFPHIDAIGRFENFLNDTQFLRQMIRAREKNREVMDQSGQTVQQPMYRYAQKRQEEACGNVKFSDGRLLKIICRIYMVDYICFEYDIPEVCRNAH